MSTAFFRVVLRKQHHTSPMYELSPQTNLPLPVTRDVLEPILILLQSSDQEVQRAACAALGAVIGSTAIGFVFLSRKGLERYW